MPHRPHPSAPRLAGCIVSLLLLIQLLLPMQAARAQPDAAPDWQPLAAEWVGFSMHPTRWVRFGDGVHWVQRPIVGSGYRCDDGLFAGELRKLHPQAFASGKVRRCEVGAPVHDTLLPDWQGMPHAVYGGAGGSPLQMSLPPVDWAAIPHRGRGLDRQQTRPQADPSVVPRADGHQGAFRISCGFSHFAADDPLVRPGKVGGAHLHMFFGNTWADARSTPGSIAAKGGSTCHGGTVNRSAYWVPALLDEAGRPQVPHFSLWYYKTGTVDPVGVQPFPPGFAAIAGSASRANLADPAAFSWECAADRKLADGWKLRRTEMRDCAPGDTLQATIRFPPCWDGRTLVAPDHRSHLAEPIWDKTATHYGKARCPASHPVSLPELSLNIGWAVPPGSAGSGRWRLSSDAYPADLPGGRSMHADFVNGWEPQALRAMVAECLNTRADCHADHIPSLGRLLPPLADQAYPAEPELPPPWPHPALTGPWQVRANGLTPTRPTRVLGDKPGTVGAVAPARASVGADCDCARPAYTTTAPGSSPWCPIPSAAGVLAVCSAAGVGD